MSNTKQYESGLAANHFAIQFLLDGIRSDWSTMGEAEKEEVCHVMGYIAFQLGFNPDVVHRCVSALGSYISIEDIENYRNFNCPSD